MYKTKDEEGRKRERKRRSWGSRRSSYRQGIRQRRSKQATVQMELPGKVCDLCQICNWARTVTIVISDKSLQDRHPNSTSQPKEVRLYNKAKEELVSIDTARSSYTRSSYPSLRNARRINPRQLCKRTE